MIESESPRKNLWKNLKTEKTKLSGVDQTNNPPLITNTNYSEPLRTFALNQPININRNHFDLERQLADVQKQIEFDQHQNKHHQELHMNLINIQGTNPTLSNQQNRMRRLSVGEESIVEEIVDFKNPNSLEIGDFEEEQQPMIMSLGSQSNPAIRLLKLNKVKEDVEKLESSRIQLLKYLKEEKEKYNQAFEKTFHELLTYVIFYYSEKTSQDFDSDNQRNSILLSGNIRKSLGDDDTPRFAKQVKQKKSFHKSRQQKEKSQLEFSFQYQIQKLQEELFKAKLQSQGLEEKLAKLRQQNEQMNESIFDYEQKIAQFELQVNKKVEEIVEQRVKELERTKYNEQAESDRQYYLDQILSLEKEIEVLEKNSFNKSEYLELNEIGEQLQKKSEFLNQRELYLVEKEKQLNEFEVEMNSEKLEIEKRIKNIQAREVEIRALQSKLEQKEVGLALKQKQMSNKSFQADKQSSVLQKNGFHHRRRESGEHQYEHITDFKLKNMANFKSSDLSLNRYGRQRQQSPVYSGLEAKIWSRPAGQTSEGKYKIETYLKDKNNTSKEKQSSYYQKTFNSYTRPATYKNHNNSSSSYSTKFKQQDKSRLDDLGAKLENLRNQIRKEIKDAQ